MAAQPPAAPAPLPVTRVHLPIVDSTNTYAKLHAAEFVAAAGDGVTVVTADEQTAGRGRSGRAWVTARGADIKATFGFRVPAERLATAYLLSPLLSVVSLRALKAALGVDCQIKWPNDLLCGGARKVGGILCELESLPGGDGGGGGGYFAALGVGINVNTLPEALGVQRPAWPLTTLRAEAPGQQLLDVHGLTHELVAQFARALPLFLRDGFAPFKAEYDAASVLLGRRVRFSTTNDSGAPLVVEGRVTAIGEDGKLYVRHEPAGGGEATVTGFLSGEVSGVQLAEDAEFVQGEPQQ